MKTVRIISLHLAYGGVEKAIISMANLFVKKYNVEIICVYNMPGSPAFPLDERVKVRYLLSETPNREQWKDAMRRRDIPAFIRESFRSVRVLVGKRLAVINTVRSIHDGILITTRHEDNLVLSRYGDKKVFKIAQLHHDHKFEKKYMNAFRDKYSNIDVFALLLPEYVDEIKAMMTKNGPELVAIPNFLARYPDTVDYDSKEKIMVAVGRLEVVKGFDRLVRIFASVHEKAPEWKLRIVGEGSERALLEKLISEYDAADYIELTGRMNSDDVEKEMLRASIYAMSSKSEGFPFVILEAQSCALPTVAFDVRLGPGAMLDDGVTGYLVSDGDEQAYVERTLELMNSSQLRRQMGDSALKACRAYSADEIGDIWFSVLEGKND